MFTPDYHKSAIKDLKKTCIQLSYRQSVISVTCKQPELLRFMKLLLEYLKFHQSKAISSAALSYLYKNRYFYYWKFYEFKYTWNQNTIFVSKVQEAICLLWVKKNNTKFLPLATLRQYTCLSILNEIPFYVYTYMYMYGLGNLRLIFLEYLGCCRKHSSIFLLVKAVVGIQAFSANPSLKSLIV